MNGQHYEDVNLPDAHPMATVQVDEDTCRQCWRCFASQVCHTKALIQRRSEELPVLALSGCDGCLCCVEACPFGSVLAIPNRWSASIAAD